MLCTYLKALFEAVGLGRLLLALTCAFRNGTSKHLRALFVVLCRNERAVRRCCCYPVFCWLATFPFLQWTAVAYNYNGVCRTCVFTFRCCQEFVCHSVTVFLWSKLYEVFNNDNHGCWNAAGMLASCRNVDVVRRSFTEPPWLRERVVARGLCPCCSLVSLDVHSFSWHLGSRIGVEACAPLPIFVCIYWKCASC